MRNPRPFLYLTVFIAGMTSLAIELAASRLIGNVYGSSNLVWACIIGLILIYLTLGNFLGGRFADRSPHPATFYTILAWAAFSVGLIPVIARPVLRLAAQAFDELSMGILAGAFVAVLVLFIIPVTLLGMASPFAIRLAITDPQSAGSISGRIYAISTLGSFLGTFLPVLVLIPLIGTFRTFLFFAIVLVSVALLGLLLNGARRRALLHGWMPLVLALLTWWGVSGPFKTTPGLVYESESAYNYIQVLESDGYYLLRLNDGQGVHSIYHPTELYYAGPWEQVLAAPFFNPAPYNPDQVTDIAIVGLAAGTTARQATAVYGEDVHIDGFEIDPDIIEVGRQYFGMDLPNLNAETTDGRWGLEHSTRRYQIISVDAYRPPYIPNHLTTQEFFQIVHDHLTEDGVMVINIGRSAEDRSLINGLATTIRTIFPSIYVIDIPNTFNSILYATVQPTHPANLAENLDLLAENPNATHPLLYNAVAIAVLHLQPEPPTTQVFTDDQAPIEWLTNRLVINYVLFGDLEALQ